MAATRWQTPSISGSRAGDVVEQGVQGGQALVAGADVVAAVVLEVTKEPEDPVEGQVLEAGLVILHPLSAWRRSTGNSRIVSR